MDDLFAAIAAFLRERNKRLTTDRAPVERIWTGSLRAYAGRMPHCCYCGAPIEPAIGAVSRSDSTREAGVSARRGE